MIIKAMTFNVAYFRSEILTAISFTDLLSILGVRLLFNIKEAGHQETTGGSFSGTDMLSPLEVARGSYRTLPEINEV